MTLKDRTGQQTRHELAATVPSYDRSAHRSTVPRMTRRHFRVIAEALAEARPTVVGSEWSAGKASGWWDACESMARALSATNPQFDRARFLAWCEE